MQIVPRKSRLKLPPVKFGEDESLGQRIARLRKERAITQQELAERIGTIQVLVSDYERDRIRVTAEMVVRIAEALEMSADELLGMKRPKLNTGSKASRRVLRRVERVEQLPPQQQTTLLRTIDTFLKAAEK
jgi:transcriptional regulator with XRE-family HTH domain